MSTAQARNERARAAFNSMRESLDSDRAAEAWAGMTDGERRVLLLAANLPTDLKVRAFGAFGEGVRRELIVAARRIAVWSVSLALGDYAV